jgi:hypothetical protein
MSFDTSTQTMVTLNEIAKYATFELTWRLYRKGKVKPDEFGKKWYRLAQDLLKAWMRELVTSLAENIYTNNYMVIYDFFKYIT